MFTKQQIEEIAYKLKLLNKKDSQFEKAKDLNDSEELAILQEGKNRKLSLSSFIQYLSSRVGKPSKYYSIRVNATPSDAEVTINGKVTNVDSFLEGTLVSIIVKKDGYKTETRSLILSEDTILNIELTEISTYYDVYVNATPSNSTIFINNIERKSARIKEGTAVKIEVSSEGYKTYTNTFIINRDTFVDVSLSLIEEKNVTFIINPTPSDAIVTINGSITKSIMAVQGSTAVYEVKKTGYKTVSGTIVLDQDITKYINLSPLEDLVFTIYPSPIDNTDIEVTINDETTIINSSSEKEYAEYHFNEMSPVINYSIHKDGYNDVSGTETLVSSKRLDVTLTKEALKKYAVTWDIRPVDATVKVDGEIIDISEPYYGYIGDGHTLQITREGYYFYSGSFVITGNMTISKYLKEIVNFKIICTDSSFNNLAASSDGTTITLKAMLNNEDVSHIIEWSVESGSEYVNTSAGVNNVLNVEILPNISSEDRSIVIKGTDSNNNEAYYRITQLGSEISYFLSVDVNAISFDYTGGTKVLNISSNIEYNIEIN